MGAGTSKIPNLKNLSSTDLIEIQISIPILITKAKEREAKLTLSNSETQQINNEGAQVLPESRVGGKKRKSLDEVKIIVIIHPKF